jgi:hypothetical protein
MTEITVRIDSEGRCTPSTLDLNTGDTVTFSVEADTVLCVAPDKVFGAERFEIPAGESRRLHVQATESSSLDFVARIGDLAAPCRGGDRDRTSGGGGGSVGGGLD